MEKTHSKHSTTITRARVCAGIAEPHPQFYIYSRKTSIKTGLSKKNQ